MTLTKEQKERIAQNKKRAYQLRCVKALEDQRKYEENLVGTKKRRRNEDMKEKCKKEEKVEKGISNDDVLENFELGASESVSKREATEVYCLPKGTLAICKFVEKKNPYNTGFTSMKLYNRTDIRRLARERFGGLEGLVAERRKREEKRLAKDLQVTKDIFKSEKGNRK